MPEIDFTGVEEAQPKEQGIDFSGIEGVDFSVTEQPEPAPEPERYTTQQAPEFKGPDTLDVNAQPDLTGLQDLPGVSVAPGMPTNVSEVAPQGLNERGITAIVGSPVGIPETAANFISGTGNFTLAKLSGLIDTAGLKIMGSKDPVGEGRKFGEWLANKIIPVYQPRSESGKELSGFVGGTMELPIEAAKNALEVSGLPKWMQDEIMEGALTSMALSGFIHTFKPRTLDEYIMKSNAETAARSKRQTPAQPAQPTDWNAEISSIMEPYKEQPSTEAAATPGSPEPATTAVASPSIPERRAPEDVLRQHVEDLGNRIATGDKTAVGELLSEFKDPVSGAHNKRAFDIMEQKEGPAPIIMSQDIKGLHAVDTKFGQQVGDNYVRALAKAYEDEGIPVYRYGKQSDEFISRFKDQTEAFDAKKRVENRFRDAILEVPTEDGGARYFTNLEAYTGVGGHYGEKSAQENAFNQLYERKRIAKADPNFNRESLPGNFVELSPEDFASRQKAGWSEVSPAPEKTPEVTPEPAAGQPHPKADLIKQAASFMDGKTRYDESFPFMSWRHSIKKENGKWQQMTIEQAGEWLDKVANGEATPRTEAQKTFLKKAIEDMQEYNERAAAFEKAQPVGEVRPNPSGELNLGLNKGSDLRAPERENKPVSMDELPLGKATNEARERAAQVELYSFPSMLHPKKVAEDFKAIKEDLDPLWQKYSHVPEFTDYKKALGKYLGDRQQVSYELNKFAKKVQKEIPEVKQEGITNWIEAGGDRATLENRMNATKDEKLKTGYKAALELSPNEVSFAEAAKKHFDEQLDRAIEAGIIEDGVENYVNHIWDRDNAQSKKVKGEINAGLLRTNPKLAKKRVWETFFEGEQAGGKPKDKRIGYLMTAYDQALGEAIASRLFVKSLLKAKASDGRPAVSFNTATGTLIKEGEVVKGALIKPNAKAEEISDYLPINHPALRKWIWSTTIDGKPVFMQGDFLIHPEVYGKTKEGRDKYWQGGLKNVLGKSAIQQSWLGRNTLRLSAEFKSTLLSLSGFHQVQEGVHAIFHKVNPAGAPEINFRDPAQKSLIDHGLMVYDHDALQNFSEGVHATGLVNRVPKVGPVLMKYQSYLFQDYIPRLKMAMAREALERNRKRYAGKLSDDQIQEMTANQANAAFGELNYKMMGRNKTMQDVFRLMALAPDFLEARARFVGQALKPYGKEQSTALIRGALGMYAGAVMLNMLLSDDNKGHWDKPFTVVIGDREYALRSIPGDLIHLFRDPRSFVYARLNPTVARTIIEQVTGRDQWGNKKTLTERFDDLKKNIVPIPLQGPLWKEDSTLLTSVLGSLGIASWKHRTEAEKMLRDYMADKRSLGGPSENQKERIDAMRDIRKQYAKGEITSLAEIRQAAKEAGVVLSGKQMKSIIQGDNNPKKFSEDFKRLTAEEALKVWEVADDDERMQVRHVILNKIMNARTLTQQDKREFRRKVMEE